jgi:elongation factor 1-gamma
MSSNQISGFFDRLEASRKYVMGSGVVFGENNNSKIAGVVIARGSDFKDSLGVAPDLESYAVTPLNPFDKPEDKEFFEKTLAWEGEVDGLKAAVGKFLK